MNILRPITITDSMVVSSFPENEDPTPVWVSGTSYTVGQEVHRTQTHRVYRCAAATSGTIPPEQAVTVWVDVRPTNRWALFDYYTNTKTSNPTGVEYKFNLGSRAVNAVYLRGFSMGSAFLRIYDATDTLVSEQSKETTAPPGGWYEYLFAEPVVLNYLLFDNLVLQHNWKIKISIISYPEDASIGLLTIGDLVPLGNNASGSGVERGSSAEPITYSYINTEEDGTTTIRKRHSATNLRLSSTVPISEADNAVYVIQSVLDTPVAVIADSQNNQLQGLSTFGLVSGSVTYDYTTANISLNVKGLV